MKQMMTMTRDVVLLASGMLALSAGAFSFTPSRFVGVYRDGENASFVSSNVAGGRQWDSGTNVLGVSGIGWAVNS